MPNNPHELPEEVNKRITQACYEYEEGQLGKHMPFIRHLVAQELATAHQQGAEEERETMKKLIHEAIWAEKETINGRIIEFSEKRLLEIFGYNGKPLTERETE